jgi:superfamily II DNA or RNA helicase
MAIVTMTGDELAVHDLVGTSCFLAARRFVAQGQVRVVTTDPQEDGVEYLHGTVEPRGQGSLDVVTLVERQPDRRVVRVEGSCSCTQDEPCPHCVALLLAEIGTTTPVPAPSATPASTPSPVARTMPEPATAPEPPDEPQIQPPAWAGRLTELLQPRGDGRAVPALVPHGRELLAGPRVALQFEITAQEASLLRLLVAQAQRRGEKAPKLPMLRILVRPVRRSDAGNWVRSGIAWHTLSQIQYRHAGVSLTSRQLELLAELHAMGVPADPFHSYGYYGGYASSDSPVDLASLSSRRVWDVLAEIRDEGVPLLWTGREAGEVRLLPRPVRADVDIRRATDEGGLEVRARLSDGSGDIPLDRQVLLGRPAHGILWWPEGGRRAGATPWAGAPLGAMALAPLAEPLTPLMSALVDEGGITVSATDTDTFLADYYPRLREQVAVVSSDASVDFPREEPPALRLVVTGDQRVPQVDVEWSWLRRFGGAVRTSPLSAVHTGFGQGTTDPMDPGTVSPGASAQVQLDQVATTLAKGFADLPELFETARSGAEDAVAPALAARARLVGVSAARFLAEVLPALDAAGVVTEVTLREGGQGAGYRVLDAEPVISFTGSSGEGETGEGIDWFDLAVTITVDGRDVPFVDLFTALAQEQTHLLLPDGGYFSLDRERFRELARLIAESKALLDAPSGTVRLTRFQVGAWGDVERLGSVSGPAVASWRQSVHALLDAAANDAAVSGEVEEGDPVPELRATLRPYQRTGLHWLTALHRYGLGGVLADDMGLGKTLQVLALILRTRRSSPGGAPWLVVAPTSVVATWAAEASRFAPDLPTVTITETASRRRRSLAEATGDAGLVVTSYTLLRIEYAEYERLPWSGLILDEAQAVKNHQSAGYRCVRDLRAPFKLAVTGTPIENNLMELWSLMSVTAPGLFGSAARFSEHYRSGIERGRDPELLGQLRRRLRPLMLRRTKELVAADLPDKQEQVIELELPPKHRTVYDRYLHRERQKVLGLLGDLRRNRIEIFRSLTLLRQAALAAALVDPAHDTIGSAKLDTLLQQLREITEEGHRVLVFSQFTRFLAMARTRIEAAGIGYRYLDGRTRNRPEVIESFRSGDAPVFLISLKAGGTGLTLTEADYVILLDPWWNPATEAQAVDRVHRIGQTRKVMVYRLVAKNTIEDKVMALKASKSALISSVLDAGDLASGALGAEDIRALIS